MVTVSDQHLLYQWTIDRGSSTILRVMVVVQAQLKVLYVLATHPSSEDVKHHEGAGGPHQQNPSDLEKYLLVASSRS
jgi:hypothetical protein